MRIVVTGGSGFLGSRTVSFLAAAGHQVVSVDATPSSEPGVEWHVADLRRRESPYGFLRGAAALIHLANHSHSRKADAQTVLAENTAMNTNVFQSAVELGVGRLVFASSVQAMSGGPLQTSQEYPEPPERRLPPLPVTGDSPAHAGNTYGLSKVFGELLLAHYVEHARVEAVAIRFPFINGQAGAVPKWFHPRARHLAAEFFGWLWIDDAARLLLACTTAPSLPGFRIYHPSGPLPADWPSAEALAGTHLADAPRRRPGEPLDTLIDNSALAHELGWRATPLPKHSASA